MITVPCHRHCMLTFATTDFLLNHFLSLHVHCVMILALILAWQHHLWSVYLPICPSVISSRFIVLFGHWRIQKNWMGWIGVKRGKCGQAYFYPLRMRPRNGAVFCSHKSANYMEKRLSLVHVFVHYFLINDWGNWSPPLSRWIRHCIQFRAVPGFCFVSLASATFASLPP